jgi:RNA polymerase sigma-70 factor (ECF subfamily)
VSKETRFLIFWVSPKKLFEPSCEKSCLKLRFRIAQEYPQVLTTVSADVANNSDIELIERCVNGDRGAFRHLYRRYEHKVRATLYQLCGSSLLDDLVQEVFLRVWKGLPKLKQRNTFSTWLYRITWNVATDQRESFAKQHSLEAKLSIPDRDRVVESSELMNLHYQDLVQRGLDHLSFEHRAVLVLHDLEDVPQKEVAEILGVPVGTVKSRLFHARSAIRQFLQKQGVNL